MAVDKKVFPTKGNLMATKKSLKLAKMGYGLLDKKRNVLIKEMMSLVEKVSLMRREITDSYAQAYYALQQANISKGVIRDISDSISVENGVNIKYRSVMGVEIPNISIDEKELRPDYGFSNTNSQIDKAYVSFNKVKKLTVILAEVDNSVYRLANEIRKTQKRANALQNIVIPNLEDTVKFIADALEEKEREEFSRLKVIKSNKEKEVQL
jgi:V/A-type H+-transporting ATPase subunit D